MVSTVVFILAMVVLVMLLFGVIPVVGIIWYVARFILIVAAILVLYQLITNRKVG